MYCNFTKISLYVTVVINIGYQYWTRYVTTSTRQCVPGLFPVVKRPEPSAERPPPSSTEVSERLQL